MLTHFSALMLQKDWIIYVRNMYKEGTVHVHLSSHASKFLLLCGGRARAIEQAIKIWSTPWLEDAQHPHS